MFKTTDSKFISSDLSKEERQAMLSLADDRIINIKADKGCLLLGS